MDPALRHPGEEGDPRLRARADLLWYLRHADALRRWPVIPEDWALAVERNRLAPLEHRNAPDRGTSER